MAADAFASVTLGVPEAWHGVYSQSFPGQWVFSGREGDEAPASFKNAFSCEVALEENKMLRISPQDSWKMSRMNQLSAVWVGSRVCTALSVACFQGQRSLQEGQCVLEELRVSLEDHLLHPCQICSPASIPVLEVAWVHLG